MATSYSIKCVAVSVSQDGTKDTITVEQRNLAADPTPLRTFDLVVPAGTTTAGVVAAAKAEIAAWKAAQDAAAAAATAYAAEVARLASLVGQATTITV